MLKGFATHAYNRSISENIVSILQVKKVDEVPDDALLDAKRVVLKQLLQTLVDGHENEEMYLNIYQIFNDVSSNKQLYDILSSEEFFADLFKACLDSDEKKSVAACRIASVLIRNLRTQVGEKKETSTPFMDTEDEDDVVIDEDSKVEVNLEDHAIVKILLAETGIPALVASMDSVEAQTITLQSGIALSRLGAKRLAICQVLSMSMILGVNALKPVLIPGYVKLFELLTQFPQNSFLQCLVEASFTNLLKTGYQQAAEAKKPVGIEKPFDYVHQVLKDADILAQIAAQADSHVEFEFESSRKIRNPHMAFCTLLGNLIQTIEGTTEEEIAPLADARGIIELQAYIAKHEAWQAYVAGDLNSINTLNASSLAPRDEVRDDDSDDDFGNFAQAHDDDKEDEGEDEREDDREDEEEAKQAADSLRTFDADEASDDHISQFLSSSMKTPTDTSPESEEEEEDTAESKSEYSQNQFWESPPQYSIEDLLAEFNN